MKIKSTVQIAGLTLALATLNAQHSICQAQGSLTPPGAPAPTMKSLDQIEPRIPISFSGFTITQPGSYYLTTNISATSFGNAITIGANQVSLDLNGFTISSSSPNSTNSAAILIGGIGVGGADIHIFNGHISGGATNNGSGVYNGAGFDVGIGINLFAHTANVRVSNVTVSGMLFYGIYLGTNSSTVVENCEVRTAGGYGIGASMVKSSVATDCGNVAIVGDQVMDCKGQSTGSHGILAYLLVQNSYGYCATNNSPGVSGIACSGTAQNCYGVAPGQGYGVNASSAENCYGVAGQNGTGVYANSAVNCTGYSAAPGGNGVGGYSAQNCYGYCASGVGVFVTSALNCYGYSGTSFGVEATTATGCCGVTGAASPTTGLYVQVGNSCSGTRVEVIHNLNCY